MSTGTLARMKHVVCKRPRPRSLIIFLFGFALSVPGTLFSQNTQASQKFTAANPQSILTRHYQAGEVLHYKMRGTNQGHLETIRYDARANGSVKKNPSGIFVEEFSWADLHVNNAAVPLSSASRQFREYLSLSPDYRLSIPDLSKVQPILIGPITDLLTFYADVQLAMNQPALIRAGDHVYMKHGTPNSWADGTSTLLGQDAIDFDLTLQSINHVEHFATLIVRHVSPQHPQVKLPADWMRTPVSDSANNWVEVEKSSDGKYIAEVGKETFVDEIKISLPSGKIISASMDNPVQVLERECSDSALTVCGDPMRYQIRRQIVLSED